MEEESQKKIKLYLNLEEWMRAELRAGRKAEVIATMKLLPENAREKYRAVYAEEMGIPYAPIRDPDDSSSLGETQGRSGSVLYRSESEGISSRVSHESTSLQASIPIDGTDLHQFDFRAEASEISTEPEISPREAGRGQSGQRGPRPDEWDILCR